MLSNSITCIQHSRRKCRKIHIKFHQVKTASIKYLKKFRLNVFTYFIHHHKMRVIIKIDSSEIRERCDDVVRWSRGRRGWRKHADRMEEDRLAKTAYNIEREADRPLRRPPKRMADSWIWSSTNKMEEQDKVLSKSTYLEGCIIKSCIVHKEMCLFG